jgi:5S rRNA maturation endonuclease (ribonuclease M5)
LAFVPSVFSNKSAPETCSSCNNDVIKCEYSEIHDIKLLVIILNHVDIDQSGEHTAKGLKHNLYNNQNACVHIYVCVRIPYYRAFKGRP